ncbi:MAG: type II toxin-antitoxin system VapC family toxin [Mesorhizobium sp.]|nr:type II toxin-antitoxin system VapC family toxin [Mesorhizobium sp.]
MTTSLDTNVCIAIIRGKDPVARRRLERHDTANVVISSIVYFELFTGAVKSRDRDKAVEALNRMIDRMQVIDFSREDAESAASLRALLESQGKPIGPLDTLIAGQALARGFTVATNNAREFSRVPGLRVEDWLSPG